MYEFCSLILMQCKTLSCVEIPFKKFVITYPMYSLYTRTHTHISTPHYDLLTFSSNAIPFVDAVAFFPSRVSSLII